MARSAETEPLSFLRGLRSRKHAFAVLALLACIMAAQAALIVHRLDHTSIGHNVACSLCLAADHQVAVVAQATPALAYLASESAAPSTSVAERAELDLAYRSRAPPHR